MLHRNPHLSFFQEFPCYIPTDKEESEIKTIIESMVSDNIDDIAEKLNDKVYRIYNLSSAEIYYIENALYA